MHSNTNKPACVIVGVGPGNGEALARTFADAGHAVALLARRHAFCEALAAQLPDARAFACEATDAAAVERTFALIAEDMGDIATLVYNAGKGVWGAVDQVSQDDFEQAWRVNALGLFLAARQVIPTMKSRGAGNIVVIGATASRRGVAGTAAFAPAKMAQRALTESMARHLGPSGIHVSLLILDGAVGGPEPRVRFRDRPDDAFIAPEAIASTALQLTLQDRSAWSFEVDLRPFNEKW
ncbi:MAG: SDR family NAD(P)-dependent oxidoreductase [Lysobacter sp.]|nr:SDR family NAD(P)-dependent oxidoreductase [Lysobacter sp.]